MSWSPHSNDHLAIWEPNLNPSWVLVLFYRLQKDLNIELNCKFSKPYSLFWPFLTKANGFLIRWKIMWVDLHVPTIIFVYGNTLWTIYGLLPQKHPNVVLYGMFSQPYSYYPVRARASTILCFMPRQGKQNWIFVLLGTVRNLNNYNLYLQASCCVLLVYNWLLALVWIHNVKSTQKFCTRILWISHFQLHNNGILKNNCCNISF